MKLSRRDLLKLGGVAFIPQICERADREAQLGVETEFGNAIAGLTGDCNWTGIMPFRMGCPTEEALLSSRRGLAQVVGR